MKNDPAATRGAPMSDAPALQPKIPVTVILQCTPLPDHPWLHERRSVVGVLPRQIAVDAPAPKEAGSEPTAKPDGTQILRFDRLVLELHPDEADSYYLNLLAEPPRCFVVMHEGPQTGQPEPLLVTVSADLAASYESVDHRVDVVPLDPALYPAVEAFVLTHYIPQKMVKRKRKNWQQS